jgi:hypothetical protein
MTPIFSEPTEDDLKLLAERWDAVQTLANEELETEIDQSPATLDVLQRILDGELVNHDGLLAVGVALGRVMASNIPGLNWCAVADEFGRELCLRYEQTTLHVNPVAMISKRVSRNEKVDVMELFQSTKLEIERLGGIVDR